MKNIYRIITLGFSILALNLIAINVNAAELSADTNNKISDSGELKLPLILKVNEEETISQITLGCNIEDNMDVSCSFEKGSNVTLDGNSSKTIVKYIAEDGNFPKTDTLIAYLVLKNSTTNAATVKVTVDSTVPGKSA